MSTTGDTKFYFVRSEHDSPTLYFSFLPQFAQKLKEQGKGIIFCGDNFVLGLLGTNKSDEMVAEVEKVCKEMSSKPVKMNKKGDVKFDFKIKGQKPVVTKEICQFSITGADFNFEKITEVLKKHNVDEMD